jgi:ComF family protein
MRAGGVVRMRDAVSGEEIQLSNFLDSALDNWRRGALEAARRALPQRCELCAAPSAGELLCSGCTHSLPRLGPACPVCALPTAGGEVCGHCLANAPPFAATLAAFAYAFPVDRLMHAFKYHGRLALAEWAAAAILAEHRQRNTTSRPDRLVALPLSRERQRERGYNQAFEIARVLARELRIPLLRNGVSRERAAPPQAALPWSERANNVRGAFACELDLGGMTVAVIDDVMTTGASLAEFARTLKRAGAKRVENWVVARTLPPA